MILFHGTSTKCMSGIKEFGLLPRGKSGVGNYDGDLQSNPEHIYLTDVYALHFGLHAVAKHGGRVLVASVEVTPDMLLPDDDFTDRGKHHYKATDGMDCLRYTGTCCIKAESIMPRKLYEVSKSWIDKCDLTRIRTGLLHTAIKQQMEDQLHHVLMFAKKHKDLFGDWVIVS